MPELRARLALEARYSAAELARIRVRLVPGQMEDKWFIFLEGDWLSLYRSWTGYCLYHVRLQAVDDGVRVAEAWVNRDPQQYTSTDDAYDAVLLAFLIDRLLLGKAVPFPMPDGFPSEGRDLFRHHMIGWARANDERPG
jgi:hypothetical protein